MLTLLRHRRAASPHPPVGRPFGRAARIVRRPVLGGLLAPCALFFCGCVSDYYVSGPRMGTLPSSDWNVNGILLGARGGARTTHWSLLHDYESLVYPDNSAPGGWKLKLLGPYFPALLGAIDMNGESGFVTPLYSQHSGNLDSVAIGPLGLPVFRLDTADMEDYWQCDVLGIIHFGTPGWSIGVGSFGISSVRQERWPLYLEVTTRVADVPPEDEGDAPGQARVPDGAPDIWDGL